jgi:hypothetical protein
MAAVIRDDVIRCLIGLFAGAELPQGPDAGLNESTSLLELGLIDSLTIVALRAFVSKTFGVDLPARDLTPGNLHTLNAIADLVMRVHARGEVGTEGTARIRRQWHGEGVPLSSQQLGLWLKAASDPGSKEDSTHHCVRLTGKLDRALLQRALNELLRRHGALRSRFSLRKPSQSFASEEPATLEFDQGAPDLNQIILNERPFDLVNGPICHFKLYRVDDNDHVLVYTAHHLVSDGHSRAVFVRDLVSIYDAISRDRELPPELVIQYADYVLWQAEPWRKSVIQRQLSYWERALKGPVPQMQLTSAAPKLDGGRSATPGENGRVYAPLRKSLADLGARQHTTLFNVLLAGVSVVLGHLSGEPDLWIGVPFSNRSQPETQGLIGQFADMVVIRVGVSTSDSFEAILQRVRETVTAAANNADVSLRDLDRITRGRRDAGKRPLFNPAFNYHDYWEPRVVTSVLTATSLESDAIVTGAGDLNVDVHPTPDGLSVWAFSRTRRLDAEALRAVLDMYLGFLAWAVSAPARTVGEYPFGPLPTG